MVSQYDDELLTLRSQYHQQLEELSKRHKEQLSELSDGGTSRIKQAETKLVMKEEAIEKERENFTRTMQKWTEDVANMKSQVNLALIIKNIGLTFSNFDFLITEKRYPNKGVIL